MENAQFTESDIKDKLLLERLIESESRALFDSPYTRRSRSLEEIKGTVKQGKTLELWLTENYAFQLSDSRYHDLIDENGDFVEVKAYNVQSSSAPYVQKSLASIRTGKWNKSKWFILFNYNKGVYKFLEKIKI
jgi:hypothetical protein